MNKTQIRYLSENQCQVQKTTDGLNNYNNLNGYFEKFNTLEAESTIVLSW